MRKAPALIVLAALGACGKSDNAPGPGGVTLGEAKALDEAAEMIEKRQLSSGAPTQPAPAAPATTAP